MGKHRNWHKRLAAFDGIVQRNKRDGVGAKHVVWTRTLCWFLVVVALCVLIWAIF
jgi:hypothetical protein